MGRMTTCNHPLSYGRACCRIKGHAGRHSHTWQKGDARYLAIDERLIDMETGEVVGYTGGLGQRIVEEIIGERTRPQQAHARHVLEVMYGTRFSGNPRPVYAAPPEGYTWHHEGTYKAYGTDDSGHGVEFDFGTGKVRRIYSLNERRDVVAYARRFGSANAARKFDIPSATVRAWIGRRGK